MNNNYSSIFYDGRHYDLRYSYLVEDIPFLLRQIERYGGPVLELACGTGRIAIPAALKGIAVVGMDFMESMLAVGKRKAQAQGANVEWVNADCCDFSLGRKFSVIIFPFNSLSHITERKRIEQCFSCVQYHLKEDGVFILDYLNPKMELLLRDSLVRYPASEYNDPDGKGKVVLTVSTNYDAAKQVNNVTWHYSIGNTSEEIDEELPMRIYFPQELDSLLEYNGFKILYKYGDYDESPLVSSSPKQLFICKAR